MSYFAGKKFYRNLSVHCFLLFEHVNGIDVVENVTANDYVVQ